MPSKNKLNKFRRIIKGSTIEYDLSAYYETLNNINKLEGELAVKSDKELRIISDALKKEVSKNFDPDNNDLLTGSFALVREAVKRVLKIQPFDVQLIGGLVLHKRRLAEMATGEGKTLTAVFPAYLNALTGGGVHVLTFNDYLAKRDALIKKLFLLNQPYGS